MPHYIHDTCIGCTACAPKCPTEAIIGEKKMLHVIIDEKCIDCGVCGNVCPVSCITDQFDRVVPKRKITDRPRPVINKDNCTGCTYCVDYCPENCLEMTGEGVIQVSTLVREKVCIGCALCAEICPHDAIVMTDAMEAKQMISAGVINAFYVRNAGPDNQPAPAAKPPSPTVTSAT
jgi:formate hydrogenlyase subunit 6/NADH:ubiquinone oxidoreductase subunit I